MTKAGGPRLALALTLMFVPAALAGCIGTDGPNAAAPASLTTDIPTITVGAGDPLEAAEGWWYTSPELQAEPDEYDDSPACWFAECPYQPIPCTERNCRSFTIDLDVPDDHWDRHDGALKVVAQWTPPEGDWAYMWIRVYDASGERITNGMGGGDASVAIIEEPMDGTYTIEYIVRWGRATFDALVQLEAEPAGPARDLLPDLVVLPPTNLAIETPGWTAAEETVLGAAGVEGCSTYEAVERQAQRCLRLANRVGNIGEGPFEILLSTQDQATGMAGMGQHIQRIHASDGTTRDVDAGPASFHPTHMHFHYDGLTEFAVYEHDLATGERGALVNEGNKGGVCLVHSGLVQLGLPNTGQPMGGTCFYAGLSQLGVVWGEPPAQDMSMFLASNWYDYYGRGLDDMYVDMTGAPDGVYELVSSTNGDGTVTESDHTNNEARVVFKLTGDDVEVLASYASWPGGDGL